MERWEKTYQGEDGFDEKPAKIEGTWVKLTGSIGKEIKRGLKPAGKILLLVVGFVAAVYFIIDVVVPTWKAVREHGEIVAAEIVAEYEGRNILILNQGAVSGTIISFSDGNMALVLGRSDDGKVSLVWPSGVEGSMSVKDITDVDPGARVTLMSASDGKWEKICVEYIKKMTQKHRASLPTSNK